MDIIIAIIVSLALGSAITFYVLRRGMKYIGTLVIDRSEPSEPLPFIEVNKGVGGIEGISAQKYVILSVENRSYAPHD